jgi:haloacetate dehalogenase
MFEDFEQDRVITDDAEIFVLRGGRGPPLLLLHGYPQNHVMWHAVAEPLAARFSVVLPDLRGYGDSKGPLPHPTHVNYSKREMAADMVAVMSAFGHERFFLAGHDRGGRVAYRLALDRPAQVERLALLDLLPTPEVWDEIAGVGALRAYHWLLLGQPPPLPERLIAADPEFWVRHLLLEWGERVLNPAAVEEYIRHFSKLSVITAACEDYRAGASVDLEQDRADHEAGRKIACAVLVLWSKRFLGRQTASPLAAWRRWADDVRDHALDCGHFVAEEEPDACAAALIEFFSS